MSHRRLPLFLRAMNGHLDVDLPNCLRHRLGSLLACLERYLEGRVVQLRRVEKEPGGHATPWWIYAQLSPAAKSSSVVVFGETDHAEVNAVPHLWVRGKEKWIGAGFHAAGASLRTVLGFGG